MAVLVTGAAGFIGSATARACSIAATRSSASTTSTIITTRAEAGAAGESCAQFGNRFRFERVDFADAEALAALHRHASRSTASSTSAPRPAFATASKIPRAYIQSNLVGHGNMLELARAPPAAPHGLCIVVLGLWRQQEPAVPSRGPRRSSTVALRRDQEGRRADERKLCQPVSNPADRPPLLHRLRPVGTAGHGDVDLPEALYAGEPLPVFNGGEMRRDFTYIDDIVAA